MKIIINGAGGRMGKALAAMLAQRDDITVIGKVDPFVEDPTDPSWDWWNPFDPNDTGE